jgi:replicative DNA helicase
MDVKELLNYDGPDRVVLSSDYWEMIKNEKPAVNYKTGFSKLDEAIDGIEGEEVIVVSGPTGHGKTTFCRTVMMRMAAEGKRSLFFTFENAPKKIASEHRTLQEAIYMPLQHHPMNLDWIERRSLEAALKFKDLSAIFLDHLHYVLPLDSAENMSLRCGHAMRFIKQQIAVKLGVPVFVVAHMTKIPNDQEPSIGHLRDSALIACEADTVLVIWRRKDVDPSGRKLESSIQNLAMLKVDKARRVGTMGLKIEMFKDGLRLMEIV